MRYLLGWLFTLPVHFLHAQQDEKYDALTARAGLAHLQKDHKLAIGLYEQAFAIRPPDQLNAYKAAGVYALDSNLTKAFYYLQSALDSGWVDAGWINKDPYFNTLRNGKPLRWIAFINTASSCERRFERTISLPKIRKAANEMALNDQQLRYEKIQAKTKEERKAIDERISEADAENLTRFKIIIRNYGFPGTDQIGKDGQNNLWLIIQHADHDILYQQEVLNEIEKKMPTGKIQPDCYAFLYDRVQCNLNYKQVYGTQVIWGMNGTASGFRPIIREDSVNIRRKTIGLLPLNVYSLTYGFTYQPVNEQQAVQQDRDDLEHTRTLIDSAVFSFNRQSYSAAYDYYNTASTIMGGMSDKDNYDAAVLFAKIARKDADPEYKGIALDFLNLLYLRRSPDLKKIRKQKEFSVLYNQERWKTLIEPLRRY